MSRSNKLIHQFDSISSKKYLLTIIMIEEDLKVPNEEKIFKIDQSMTTF